MTKQSKRILATANIGAIVLILAVGAIIGGALLTLAWFIVYVVLR